MLSVNIYKHWFSMSIIPSV